MTVKVHHLNCATMCPFCERLLTGQGSMTKAARFVCHCLLVESPKGLILVDSGLGTADIRDANRTLGRGFVAMMRPRLDMKETALAQIKALGFRADDVKHIVPTHLDLDHAGGLSDFPKAGVHVLQQEYDQSQNPAWHEKSRFRAAHFAHGPDWKMYCKLPDIWFGLPAVRILQDMDVQMYLVALTGHTRGHCGVAVKSGDRWLLHCGDAYFHAKQISDPDHVPVGIKVFEKLVQTIPEQRIESLERLVQLARKHGEEVDLFCAHDPTEFARYA